MTSKKRKAVTINKVAESQEYEIREGEYSSAIEGDDGSKLGNVTDLSVGGISIASSTKGYQKELLNSPDNGSHSENNSQDSNSTVCSGKVSRRRHAKRDACMVHAGAWVCSPKIQLDNRIIEA